jgi:hypothetical protein
VRIRRLVSTGALVILLMSAVAAAGAVLPPDLRGPQRARLDAVAQGATVSTRVEAEPFPGRPEVFEFLLDHPEFASRVTRVLKAARYHVWREADGLHLDDGWGAVGRFEVVYATGTTRVMYARGIYRKRFVPDIHGEAVVMLEYAVQRGPDGATLIAPTITGFVKLDSTMLAAAMKVITPLARAKADREARTLAKVFAKVTRAIAEDPVELVQDLAREPDVSAADLAAFRRLLRLP